jgi:hypothetical protein
MKSNIVTEDLHIEKIARGYRAFTPADCLIYQLEHFERVLVLNSRQKGKRIDFVHGSGSGILRQKMTEILRQKYPAFIYEDAPFATYGYQGALRVTIK